jgi:hypothetical protein
MFTDNANLGLLGKCLLEPVGQPVGVRIAYHNNLNSGILARRGWRRM